MSLPLRWPMPWCDVFEYILIPMTRFGKVAGWGGYNP